MWLSLSSVDMLSTAGHLSFEELRWWKSPQVIMQVIIRRQPHLYTASHFSIIMGRALTCRLLLHSVPSGRLAALGHSADLPLHVISSAHSDWGEQRSWASAATTSHVWGSQQTEAEGEQREVSLQKLKNCKLVPGFWVTDWLIDWLSDWSIALIDWLID